MRAFCGRCGAFKGNQHEDGCTSEVLNKRPSYRDGVDFIAHNDEDAEMEAENITALATVVMLSVMFGTTPERVARDVIKVRHSARRQEAGRHVIAALGR